MRRGSAYALRVLALAMIYIAAGTLALSLHSITGVAPLVWAPSAIGLALVLVYGLRWWPGVAIGTFVILVTHHVPIGPAIWIAATDVMEVTVGCFVLYGVLRFRPDLDRVRDVVAFVVVSTGISLFSATSSCLILAMSGLIEQGRFDHLWWAWWWSHLSGDLIVAPAILTLTRPTRAPQAARSNLLEALSLAVIGVVLVYVVLGRVLPSWMPAAEAPYYLLPLLIWAGVRFGPRGAAVASLGVSLSAIIVYSFGVGPFERLIDLHSFVAISTISTLTLSALAVERVRAVERKGAIEVAALDAIITVDEAGRVVDLNPAAESLFQVREHEVRGKDIAALCIPPRLRGAFRRGLRELAQSGSSLVVGGRYRTTAWRSADRTEFPVEIAVTRMLVDGRPLFTGFVRDISAQMLAHEALERQVAERTAALVRANLALERRDVLMRQAEQLAHLGSFEHELDRSEVKWSDELYRIYGREVASFQPTFDTFIRSVHPDDRDMVRATIEHGISTIEPFSFVERIIRPDGAVRVLQTQARPIADTAARAIRVVGCSQDITEREEGEQVRSRLVQLVESSDDAIIGLTPDGTIATWNRAAAKLFGYDVQEAIGKPASILIPRDRHAHLDEVLESIRRGSPAAHYELRHQRRDRSTFEASVTASAVFDAKGKIIGMSKVVRDVTKQKDVEEQLRTSLREKEVLLREIYHRVKNNLQVIASLLNIQMSGEQDHAARKSLVESQNRIHSMALVHQLLYQSKDLARIDFGDYLRNVTTRLREAYDAGDRVSVDVVAPAFRLDIDHAIPCGLIVNELVTNALTHAFPDGRRGKIIVRLEPEGGTVRLAVSDDGIGIPEGLRIEDVQSFGLRIAQTLTMQLGGTIELERAAGTRVRIEFPLAKPAPQIT